MLQEILNKQKVLQNRLNALNFKTTLERTQFIKNHLQYADQEMHELLRELKYFKEWKNYCWTEQEEKMHEENAKEEFIDALHFMLNIAIALDMDAKEIYKRYMNKNAENHKRQDNGYTEGSA